MPGEKRDKSEDNWQYCEIWQVWKFVNIKSVKSYFKNPCFLIGKIQKNPN